MMFLLAPVWAEETMSPDPDAVAQDENAGIRELTGASCHPENASNPVALSREEQLPEQPFRPLRQPLEQPFEPTGHTASSGPLIDAQENPVGPELPLRSAIDQALTANPDIALAKARLEIGKASVDQARAALFPKISASLQYSERESAPSLLGANTAVGRSTSPVTSIIYQDALSLTYPVYTGNRNQAALQRARQTLKKNEQETANTAAEVIGLTIETYVNHLRAKDLKKSACERRLSLQTQLEHARRRLAAETVVKSDVLKAEVQLESSREAEMIAANAVRIAANALNLALGQDVENPVETAVVASWPETLPPFTDLCEQLETRNFALRALKHNMEALRRGIGVERAGHLPTVSLNTSVLNSKKDFPPRDRSWSVAGAIDFKVFDGGLTHARVAEARHRYAEAQAQWQKLKQSLQAQLKNAWLEYHNALERQEVNRKTLELATEELRLSRIQVREGTMTMADHLDDQADYTRAQVNVISARFDVMLAMVRMWKLAGLLTPEFIAQMFP
jgi:TolC family type I secretion outer membrane protein